MCRAVLSRHPQQEAMKLLSASIALPSLPLLLLLIIQLFQTPATILAQNATFIALYDCPATITNYTSGSQFESNLKNLLFPTLISNGSLDGFFNTSSGTDSDTIYGLVQCRFDVSAADCQSCLTIASVSILQKCPNKMDASIRFENCLLRYSKARFFSQMIVSELRYTYWYWTNDTNITDLPVFNKQLGVLFTNLTSLASTKPLKYAIGKISYSDLFSNIYGLADCTQDLSSTDCSSCLQFVLSIIPGCCSGKKGAWVLSPSCQIRYRDIEFYKPPPALPPPPPPTKTSPVSPSPVNGTNGDTNGNTRQSSSSSLNIAVIVGPALAGAAVLLLLVLCVWYMRRKKETTKPNYSEIMDGDIRSAESLQFEFVKIRTATKNFSDSHKLGEGGFGEVYKGELPDGQEIAVKRLSKNSGQGLDEFKNEVVLLHKLQHRNLVRLLGFCLEGKETLLIYEYVPNRSLDKHLFAPTKRAYLDWGKRYKIIGGIARGLLYLHEDSRLRIIHRDLKAANILLDGEMDAKIADFGMAKLFGSNQTQGNTSRIGGTFGYIAPEYALHGLFSVKSDVFSFGVLVLEIVSGQRITSFHQPNTQQNLLSYAWKQWREGTALVLMDPTLSDSFLEYEVMKSIHIGLLCVQENVENRPTMSTVVSLLNSNSVTMAAPSQPAFFADSGTNSYMVTREQESDLYKRYEPESNQSTASTSKSDYASRVDFHKTQPR